MLFNGVLVVIAIPTTNQYKTCIKHIFEKRKKNLKKLFPMQYWYLVLYQIQVPIPYMLKGWDGRMILNCVSVLQAYMFYCYQRVRRLTISKNPITHSAIKALGIFLNGSLNFSLRRKNDDFTRTGETEQL